MPVQLRSSITTILQSIQARLIAETGLDPTRIYFSARNRKTVHMTADQDILLRVGRPNPDEGFVAGSGRVATVVRRLLTVTPRTRLITDMSDRDDLWLFDPNLGHIALEETIVDALNCWMPSDTMDNILLAEVLRWIPSEEPDREPNPDTQWGETILQFEMAYIFNHDQSTVGI
jgi:hypothetical protein